MKIQLTKENLNILKTLFKPKTGLPVHIHGYEFKENPELCAHIHNQEILIDERLRGTFK